MVSAVTILMSCQPAGAQKQNDAPVPGQEDVKVDDSKNPYTSLLDIRRGHMMVNQYCRVCHGLDGKGGRGPDLTCVELFRHGQTDREILDNIKNGITGTDMPGAPADDVWIWPIVSYIRSADVPFQKPRGDPVNGEKMFARCNCRVCHWKGTDGGRLAPNLSELRAPPSYIRTSIIDPDANFREEPSYQHDPYQRIAVVMKQGLVLEGRWLNENAYHLQFIDGQENLRTLAREEIEEVSKPRQSLMPSFRELLTDEELNDLIAFVFSLRPTSKKKAPDEKGASD